jgi:diguanylate cyclase (GGDEF)-like protein
MPILENMHHDLGRIPRWATGVIALLLVLAVGVLDAATGVEISVSVIYLVPIGIAAWYAGAEWGYGASLLAAVAWYLADVTGARAYSVAWIPVWNATVRLGFFVVLTELLRRLRDAIDAQRWLAETDPLTGLANGRRFLNALEAEVARAVRYRRPLSLAYMDLDGFKTINDKRGHHTGDAVLAAVGATLKAQVRTTDLPGRLGGDEFAVIYPETDGVHVREAVAKLQMALEAAMVRRDWPVRASIGVMTALSTVPPAEELVRLADALMYESKRGGGGGVTYGVTGVASRLPESPES